MPKIKVLPDLFKLLAGIFLTFLAIRGIISVPGREGVITTVTPSIASYAYRIIDGITIVVAYLMLFGLMAIAVWAIVSYCRNRNKAKSTSFIIDEDKMKGVTKYVNESRQAKMILDSFLSDLDKKGDEKREG